MKKILLQNHEGQQKEAAQEMQVLKQPCIAELPTGRPLTQSVREKLLNMIEGKFSEKPLILTIESYLHDFHLKNQKKQVEIDKTILSHLRQL